MNLLFIDGLDLTTTMMGLFIVCILAVCFFEFVNGFHDTANAVATVIYTHSLKPTQAVILSGVLNFFGVVLGGLGVAMSILKLLPLTELMYAPLGENVAFLLAVLVAAIVWNLGTWYFGLPASSSHTLIGSLIGASLVFGSVSAEQTGKAYEIFLFLFITPLIGFFGALLLLSVMRKLVTSRDLYSQPEGENPPPMWIRILMILGCAGVSYNHGSNDGQKGVGLLMVVLIAFVPAQFALAPTFDPAACAESLGKVESVLAKAPANNALTADITKIQTEIKSTKETLAKMKNIENMESLNGLKDLKVTVRRQVRNVIPADVKALIKKAELNEKTDTSVVFNKEARLELKKTVDSFTQYTDSAPDWTIFLISICLGIGTMIGWKRIVETIGEKIGKSGFDYSQGFISQVVSAGTIWLSTFFKLPVSTTHIVSSSIMGAMFAKGGKGNIQRKTVINILTAWALTLPVSIALSAGLYWFFRLLLV